MVPARNLDVAGDVDVGDDRTRDGGSTNRRGGAFGPDRIGGGDVVGDIGVVDVEVLDHRATKQVSEETDEAAVFGDPQVGDGAATTIEGAAESSAGRTDGGEEVGPHIDIGRQRDDLAGEGVSGGDFMREPRQRLGAVQRHVAVAVDDIARGLRDHRLIPTGDRERYLDVDIVRQRRTGIGVGGLGEVAVRRTFDFDPDDLFAIRGREGRGRIATEGEGVAAVARHRRAVADEVAFDEQRVGLSFVNHDADPAWEGTAVEGPRIVVERDHVIQG